MAETYLNQYKLAHQDNFLHRVEVAIVAAAIAIRNEGAVPNHASRDILAKSVLADSVSNAIKFAIAVTADTSINSAVDDPTLFNRISAIWDAFALA